MSERARILVVDDEDAILKLARHALGARGYDVDTASDGAQALAHARARKPDVIVADLMMPRLDGRDLLRSLRADPAFALVPVIFLTARSSTEDRLQGLRLGADDYLSKPFHIEELALRVANAAKHRLRLRHTLKLRTAFFEKRAEGSRPPSLVLAEEPALRGSLEHVSLSTLLSMFAIDGKSGIVVVRCGAETGRLVLREGRVVAARREGRLNLDGREAVLSILGWCSGDFEYDSIDVETPDEIGLTTTQLLVEAARRNARRTPQA